MIEVKVPEHGAVVEFPDGTPPEVIDRAIKEKFYGSGQAPVAKPTFMDQVKESFSPRNLLRQAGPAGMMIGGAIGAASPVPGGALLGSGLGGALGTGAQQLGEQYLLGDQPKAPEQILTEQLKGGLAGLEGEVGGQIVGKTLGGAYGLGKEIAKEGIGPTFARRTANAPQWVLDTLDIFPGSRLLMNRYRREFNDWVVGQRAEMVKGYINSVTGKGEIGAKVGEELAEKFGGTKKAYAEFAGKEADIPITRARQVIHQHGIERNGKIWYQQYEQDAPVLKDILDHESASPAAISEWLGGTKTKGYQAVKSPELKAKLKEAFYKDIAAYDETMNTALLSIRKKADDLYGEVMTTLRDNPVFVKVLRDFAPERAFPGVPKMRGRTPSPDRIMRDIFESGSPEMTQKVLKALPEDTQTLLVGNWLESMISRSMDESKKYLYPHKWQEIFNQNRSMISKIAPDVLPQMERWTEVIMKGEGQLKRPTTPGDWAKTGLDIGSTLLSGAGGYFGSSGPLGVATPYVIAAANGLPTIAAWAWMGDGAKRLFNSMGRTGIPQLATKMATFEMEKE